jgi:hypothetical protein
MAYDRYDTRQGPREERGRWSEDRYGPRERSRDEDRGFFERAGEEISSWFGGDRDDPRERQRGSGWREIGRNEQSGWRDRNDRAERDYDRGDERGGRGWLSKESYRGFGGDSGTDYGRDEGYRPMTGDYSRSEQFRGRSSHPDPHYHEWRQRQISEIDRDYEEYRRENQQKFESEFGNWREKRQSKRQLLSQAREQMEVVGSDGEHVGTIDKIARDRVILAKSDPAAGGVHHSLGCHHVDRIEDDRLVLDLTAAEARQRWHDEDGNRALFERERSGEPGPHMLERSFSGTYRD